MGKKSLLKINVSLLLLIIVLLFCSCTNEMNMFGWNNNEQINFSVLTPEWQNTDSLSSSKTSRAMPIKDPSLNTSTKFNLIADQNDGTGHYTTLIDKEAVSFTNSIWQTISPHYWSGKSNNTINFYAYYPSDISNISHTAGSAPTLLYTVPPDVSNQIDIITAINPNIPGSTVTSTSLTFNHIFAAVKFAVGTNGLPSGTIKSITISGINNSGTYIFSSGWTLGPSTSSFTVTPSTAITGVAGANITSDVYTLMMIPQVFNNATVSLVYNNGTTFSAKISGTWNAGNVYTYNLSKTIVLNYGYSGGAQTFTVPYTGTYKIECWGASGGSINSYMGGKGAYTEGYLYLISNKSLFLYVGGEGSSDINGGFNGGGGVLNIGEATWGRSGGGATDIRLVSSNWSDFGSLKSRLMVAAGGGGANDRNYTETGTPYGCGDGGFGGSLSGGNGVHVPNSDTEGWYCLTYGATQTFEGTGIEYKNGGTTYYNSGGFGSATFNEAVSQAGGGGGYYGGANSKVHCGGSGGSSFISGYAGCNAIKESSTESNIIHTGAPNHYSGYIFTNSIMIAGNASMPSPSGGTETGHTGNGYARITFFSAN